MADAKRAPARPAQSASRTRYDAIQARERAARDAAEAKERSSHSVGHPGFAESLIPVWGSGREAVADFQEGDYAGGALNTALAASDLFLAGALAKGLLKGGGKAAFYVARKTTKNGANRTAKNPYDWDDYVRPWLGKDGAMLAPRQHGHHWLIPQNGWGKNVPDRIKNQPWNIKPMPDPVTHGRIHHRYGKQPRFNPAQRYWYGTPAWAKVTTGGAVGDTIGTAKAWNDRR